MVLTTRTRGPSVAHMQDLLYQFKYLYLFLWFLLKIDALTLLQQIKDAGIMFCSKNVKTLIKGAFSLLSFCKTLDPKGKTSLLVFFKIMVTFLTKTYIFFLNLLRTNLLFIG